MTEKQAKLEREIRKFWNRAHLANVCWTSGTLLGFGVAQLDNIDLPFMNYKVVGEIGADTYWS